VASAKAFAESKINWLAETIRRLAPEPGVMPRGPDVPRRIPSEIELRLTGERIKIVVEDVPGAYIIRAWYDSLFRQITIQGDTSDAKGITRVFLHILTEVAEPELKSRIRALAAPLNLPDFRVLVHPQKTRWGSCSVTGRVALNSLLILFPPEAVDYVMLHELCHKFEMNHSERFKQKMDELCPDWRDRDALLRQCAKELPDFLL
jgi:predicted metal-dependent hydrolase